MKTLVALLALLASNAACATCYFIYSPTNELLWQNNVPPVPMNSPSVKDEIQKLVPGGHLVVVETDQKGCLPIDRIQRTTLKGQAAKIKYD